MYILFFIELGLCSVFSIFFYYRYVNKSIPFYYDILMITTWILNFTFVALVPLDVTIVINLFLLDLKSYELSLKQPVENVYESIKILWKVLYTTVLVLSWVILPIAQECEKAGDLEFRLKLKRSLKKFVIGSLICIIALIIFVFYLIFFAKNFTLYNSFKN